MKKISAVIAAVMCLALSVNSFAAVQKQVVPQKAQYVQVNRAPVRYVPQPKNVVIVKQAPLPPRYVVYRQPERRVVVVNDYYYSNARANNDVALVAAGLLGIGLIVTAIAGH